jgi:hypothetical protein
MKTLFILNGAPYGDERTWLALAGAVQTQRQVLRTPDGRAIAAKAGVPEGLQRAADAGPGGARRDRWPCELHGCAGIQVGGGRSPCTLTPGRLDAVRQGWCFKNP